MVAASNNAVPSSPPPPEQWPAEVRKQYDPVRTLGVGGFASVTLARLKQTPEDDKQQQAELVAIKIAGSKYVTQKDIGYAHREIDILKEIHHPGIMKLIDYWYPSPKELKCAAVIALSYERGPTVEALLKHGGALSIVFGRVVMAQLIDAISYLHSKAVIHRDIKPDNVIITGASSKDNEIWDDITTVNDNDNVDNMTNEEDNVNWEKLRQKWHVTLIDFGFARALTPDDVTKPSVQLQRENLDASYHPNHKDLAAVNEDVLNRSTHSLRGSRHGSSGGDFLDLSTSSRRKGRSKNTKLDVDDLNKSISHSFQRRMSALGNRAFAAPEIVNHIQKEKDVLNSNNLSESSEIDVTDTISEFVSGYGLMVDAFSLGCTFRYMMTGVPPNRSVVDAIASQNSCGSKLLDWLANLGGSSKTTKKPGTRKVQYRLLEDLPYDAESLILGMMDKSDKTRTSVRAARRDPWILTVLSSDDNGSSNGDGKGGGGAGNTTTTTTTTTNEGPKNNELSYLQCALKHSKEPIANDKNNDIDKVDEKDQKEEKKEIPPQEA